MTWYISAASPERRHQYKGEGTAATRVRRDAHQGKNILTVQLSWGFRLMLAGLILKRLFPPLQPSSHASAPEAGRTLRSRNAKGRTFHDVSSSVPICVADRTEARILVTVQHRKSNEA